MARALLGSAPPQFKLKLHPFLHQLPPRLSLSLSLSSAVHGTITMSDDHQAPAHPSLEVLGGAGGSFLPALKTTLSRPYNPFPVVGWNRHVETIFASFFRSIPDVRLRRECLRTADDGSVALDWVSGDNRALPPESPLLILLPGLTGGSDDSYVRHMLIGARSKGWRVVVFNCRGCGESPVTTPQFYSASFLGDMHEVVAHVGARYPKANLYAVGWSLGANILVRYLGQESCACPLSGAVSLCNPFNLVIADEDFRKGFNNVYDKALARALCKIFKKHALLFEDLDGDYNIPMATNAKTVRDFDEGLTRVSFGFKSVDDYYSNSSSSDSIKDVCRPLLCIQRTADMKDSANKFGAGSALMEFRELERDLKAANDPIAPNRGIPREDIKENPNCLLIVTPKGGHLGWVAGDQAPIGAPWTDPVVMDFLEHLERGESKPLSSSSNIQGSGQRAEVVQHLEV